jgi:hypothetical protein
VHRRRGDQVRVSLGTHGHTPSTAPPWENANCCNSCVRKRHATQHPHNACGPPARGEVVERVYRRSAVLIRTAGLSCVTADYADSACKASPSQLLTGTGRQGQGGWVLSRQRDTAYQVDHSGTEWEACGRMKPADAETQSARQLPHTHPASTQHGQRRGARRPRQSSSTRGSRHRTRDSQVALTHRKKERKTYARCQACVKGTLASKSHRALTHRIDILVRCCV